MATLPNTIVITIGSTVINFPTAGTSPLWSEAVDQFAVAVANTLSSVVGPADIAPQTFTIDSYNPGTSINIPNLAFSTITVRGAYIRYSVYRNTSMTTVSETGILEITYNPTNGAGNLWETTREYTGDAKISFYVTDTGQVQFTTTTLSGSSHNGILTFAAVSNLQ